MDDITKTETGRPKKRSPGQQHLDDLSAVSIQVAQAAKGLELVLTNIRGQAPEPAAPAAGEEPPAAPAPAAIPGSTVRSFFPAANPVMKELKAAVDRIAKGVTELSEQF